MRPELYMRRERAAVDLFAAFMNVTSMNATEQNFAKLRKEISRAEKRIVKEVRMKRMEGVSVGRHPFFQSRGSYDGEKMVVPLRISFNKEGTQYYDDVVRFAKRLGFKEKAMALVARGTNNRGMIEEFDLRPTHDSMSHMVSKEKEYKMNIARELLKVARDLSAADVAHFKMDKDFEFESDEEPSSSFMRNLAEMYEDSIKAETRRRFDQVPMVKVRIKSSDVELLEDGLWNVKGKVGVEFLWPVVVPTKNDVSELIEKGLKQG